MSKLAVVTATGVKSPGYVFESETGKVIAWFDDSADARDFSELCNARFGESYSSWAETEEQLVDEDLAFSFLSVDNPYMLRITDPLGEEIFMDYNLKPKDGVEHFDNMLKASEPGCTVRFIDMETEKVVREARS